jgi:hypothetical protein
MPGVGESEVVMVCGDCGAERALHPDLSDSGVIAGVQAFVAEHSACARSIELVIALPPDD